MRIHNCLVDSRGSKNVMPLEVCHKISAHPQRCNTIMDKMDRLGVVALGEIPNVFIILSSNLVVTQTINIYVVDI